MKLALIGYGKMGQAVYNVALNHGHQIIGKFDDRKTLNSDLLQQSVCIDFTNPHAFLNNYKFIADNCKAAVIGTTGWDDSREKILTYFTTRKKNFDLC